MKVKIPRWVDFYVAGTLFIYIILDNCDGKQARKTKNSTPLGLIMDHGCDAISTAFSTIIVA